jgi:VWFA-related protein
MTYVRNLPVCAAAFLASVVLITSSGGQTTPDPVNPKDAPATPAEQIPAPPPPPAPAAEQPDATAPPPAGNAKAAPAGVKKESRNAKNKSRKDRKADGRNTKGAQSAAASADVEPEFKIRSDVELVLLDVSVKGPNGGFVSGLKKEDFKVYEDNVEQNVTVFQSQDVPVTVGLVVDNSGSVRPKKHEIVTAAITFAAQSNPQDEIFVVNFNDRVQMGLPDGIDFTDNRMLLRQAMLLNPAQGRTALYDALDRALEHLHKGRLAKKTLVVISDGGDNMSETTHDELIDGVRQSVATVYTVGIYNPDDKDKNPGFLRELARISGGEYYHPENISHLVGVCEKIAKDIRNRYTVGYSPSNISYDGKKRKLKVVATHPETRKRLEVRTRTEYLAARPESRSRAEE